MSISNWWEERKVSIPQAVSTVATLRNPFVYRHNEDSFNTASGKYCCNIYKRADTCHRTIVSIPQAVSTVATHLGSSINEVIRLRFNTASGKYCCNLQLNLVHLLQQLYLNRFNTASGKYCCNLKISLPIFKNSLSFNTASGKYCCNFE